MLSFLLLCLPVVLLLALLVLLCLLIVHPFSFLPTTMPGSYYDIDDFLAEEEAVPCTNFFDFSYLSHLDPDNNNTVNGGTGEKHHHLPKHSKIKMPLWSLHKWADLGFVRLQLPPQYNRRARELLAADPAHVALRETYFRTGQALLQLCEGSAHRNAQNLRRAAATASANRSELPRLEALLQECRALRAALLSTYTGDRLCHTLDWALSSVGDDVSPVRFQIDGPGAAPVPGGRHGVRAAPAVEPVHQQPVAAARGGGAPENEGSTTRRRQQ